MGINPAKVFSLQKNVIVGIPDWDIAIISQRLLYGVPRRRNVLISQLIPVRET